MAHITHKPTRATWNLALHAVVHAFAPRARAAPTAELLTRPRVRTSVLIEPSERRAGRCQDGFSKEVARIRTAHKWKKETVRNVAGEKQKIDGERVRQLKHLLRKKKPVARSNRTPRPKPTMSSGKLRDLRRDIEHNWQMVDGWCDGANQCAQNETDDFFLGTWRKGRLPIEATVTRDLCVMQSRIAERMGEARQETYEGAIVISVGFSGGALGRSWRREEPSWLHCFVKSEAEAGVKQWRRPPCC